MFRYFWQNKRTIVVVIGAIILTTLGVRATDNITSTFLASVGENVERNELLCPLDMVFVPSETGGFCIDKYEASPGSGCSYQDPQSQVQTRTNLNEINCKPVSVSLAVPWRYISQDQAQAACAKAGKRLPTNEEWYLAALGTPDVNSNWGPEDCHVANNWNSQPGLTGSGSKCISSAGAYDMVGNVWEWVKGTALDGVYEEKRQLPERGYIDSTDGRGLPGLTNPNTPNPNYNEDYFWVHSEGLRAFARGGYWDNQSLAGIYSIYLIYQPSSVGPGTGFRCAK